MCLAGPHTLSVRHRYVPKRVRALNFSGHHARAFSLTAFLSDAALAAAGVTSSRAASLEGNPGIFRACAPLREEESPLTTSMPPQCLLSATRLPERVPSARPLAPAQRPRRAMRARSRRC